MKSIILTLFLVTLSSPICLGEWIEVATNEDGDTYYVDFDRIIVAASLGMARDHDGYVYWWHLIDLVEPLDGSMSVKAYRQGDCDEFRYKSSNVSFYSEAMGEGDMIETFSEPDKDWTYPSLESIGELELKNVCDHVGK